MATVKAELHRVKQLRARAISVVDAAAHLRVHPRDIDKLILCGDLIVDEETDTTGARFITRASLQTLGTQVRCLLAASG